MPVLKNKLGDKLTVLKNPKILLMGAGVLVVIIIGAAGYPFIIQKFGDKVLRKVVEQQQDVSSLVGRVGSHVPVNMNETPLIAIVTDVNAAKQQSPVFYKKAENGDRLLVWSDQAILYSPTKDEVESVLTFQAPPAPSVATVAAEKATVEIRNGSGITDNTAGLVEKLRTQGLTVKKITTTTVRQAYPSSLVMNTGSRMLPASAQILSGYGTAVASSTIIGEAPAAADFLIILGQNDATTYKK